MLLTFVFISVVLSCLVLYLKKIILSKICILYCLVLLNRVIIYIYSYFIKLNKKLRNVFLR